MIEVGRRLMVAACIGLVGLVLAIGLGAGSASVSPSCSTPCGSGARPAAASSTRSSIPCVRDAACSGGFVLGAGGGSTVALLVPSALAALVLAVTRLRRRAGRRAGSGRLLDGGRFHPPRILLGI